LRSRIGTHGIEEGSVDKSNDLIALYWTTAGVYPEDREISRFDFADRVESAARAGYKGIGLWHADLEHIQHGMSLKEMKRVLDANGILYLELEFLTDWFAEGARKAESDLRKRRLLEASAVLDATQVKIGDFDGSECPMNRLIDAFGLLCREASQFGTRVGFEIMGCAVIHTLADALTLVKEAGERNGGLILDILQVVNLGISYDAIRQIPLEYLVGVELNDGTLPGASNHDPSTRLFCGEGMYDLVGFLRCIRSMGFFGPWAVEIINREYARLPLETLVNRSYSSTAATLARAC
jgi:sugar phosphate isomerase/epimerase